MASDAHAQAAAEWQAARADDAALEAGRLKMALAEIERLLGEDL